MILPPATVYIRSKNVFQLLHERGSSDTRIGFGECSALRVAHAPPQPVFDSNVTVYFTRFRDALAHSALVHRIWRFIFSHIFGQLFIGLNVITSRYERCYLPGHSSLWMPAERFLECKCLLLARRILRKCEINVQMETIILHRTSRFQIENVHPKRTYWTWGDRLD